MTKEYPQELHAIWNATLDDPTVLPHNLIMEAMERAQASGVAKNPKLGRSCMNYKGVDGKFCITCGQSKVKHDWDGI